MIVWKIHQNEDVFPIEQTGIFQGHSLVFRGGKAHGWSTCPPGPRTPPEIKI